MGKSPSSQNLTFRPLGVADVVDLQQAVRDCPPLTLHTPYTYWVALSKASGLCIGAWREDELAGFVVAMPTTRSRLFVWQIGVRSSFRGRQVGQVMLRKAWQAAEKLGLDSLETSIEPSNKASAATFASFAKAENLSFNAIGTASIRDPAGKVAEREIEYLLQPGR